MARHDAHTTTGGCGRRPVNVRATTRFKWRHWGEVVGVKQKSQRAKMKEYSASSENAAANSIKPIFRQVRVKAANYLQIPRINPNWQRLINSQCGFRTDVITPAVKH